MRQTGGSIKRIGQQTVGELAAAAHSAKQSLIASLMDLNQAPPKVRDSYTASLPALRRKLLSVSAPLHIRLPRSFDIVLTVNMSPNTDGNVPHSKPIPINTRRGRAPSVSDSSSSEESESSELVGIIFNGRSLCFDFFVLLTTISGSSSSASAA